MYATTFLVLFGLCALRCWWRATRRSYALFGLKKVAADILILWWMAELLGEELILWFQINVSDISCIELILVSTEDLVILLWSCPEKPYLAIRSLLATRYPQQTVVLYKGSKTLLLNETYPLFFLGVAIWGLTLDTLKGLDLILLGSRFKIIYCN